MGDDIRNDNSQTPETPPVTPIQATSEKKAKCQLTKSGGTITPYKRRLQFDEKNPQSKSESPIKRLKAQPVGFATISSPRKGTAIARGNSNTKKTPQKNTLLTYFTSTPKKNETVAQSESDTDSDVTVIDSDECERPRPPSPTDGIKQKSSLAEEGPKLQRSNEWFIPDDDIDNCDLSVYEEGPRSPSLLASDINDFPATDESKTRGENWCVLQNDVKDRVSNGLSMLNEEKPVVDVELDKLSDTSTEFDSNDLKMCRELEESFESMKACLEPWSSEETEDSVTEDFASSPFHQLPDHVLELIFCHLPIRHLCLGVNLVCKKWNAVVSDDKFLPWKKFYYRLKSGRDLKSCNDIDRICSEERMSSAESCLFGLIKYMKRFFKPSQTGTVSIALEKHHMHLWAKCLLEERFTDCIQEKTPAPGSVIAALCVLSDTVQDLMDVFRCLSRGAACWEMISVLDCLYCIATFLFHFKKTFGINPGHHYRLFYALNVFENEGINKSTDLKLRRNQQLNEPSSSSSDGKQLTHEQLQIVNHDLKPEQLIKIVAFAGTGKTTTLVEFTKMWPAKIFQNIIFNKSVQVQAKKMFPSNVNSCTFHSLAFAGVGYRYKSKLKGKVSAFDVIGLLSGDRAIVRAGIALRTIASFMASADDVITTSHVPNSSGVLEHGVLIYYTDEDKLAFASDAKTIWNSMINPRDYKSKISHDTYLKIYQLSHPVISTCDCLLIDEAQDYNPAMMDIVLRQKCPKIIVGDPHQQIYSFRGAVNALENLSATHVYYLTQSFRFGPEIGYIASCALETMKKEHKKTIVGGLKSDGISGTREGKLAIIARTNFSLFREAVSLCCNNRDGNDRFAFVGGISSYNWSQILDIYLLMIKPETVATCDTDITDKFIRKFKDFRKLSEYARNVDDVDLQGKIKIVESYGSKIPEYIETIHARCKYSVDSADIIFSTAHKAKGHEFDTVRLTEDYISFHFQCVDKRFVLKENMDEDESNILYVAITRAKRQLIMSSPVIFMLLASSERFDYPILTECAKTEEWYSKGKCAECNAERIKITERTFVMYRKNIKLTPSTCLAHTGGPLCDLCVSAPFFDLPEFLPYWLIGLSARDLTRDSFRPLFGPNSTKNDA